MSLFDCIGGHLAEGAMDKGWGRAAQQLFEELRQEYADRMGQEGASWAAGDETRRILAAHFAQRRRVLLLQVKAWQRIKADMDGFRTIAGAADPGEAMLAHLDKSVHTGTIANVASRHETLRGMLFSTMDDATRKFHAGLGGRQRNKALMRNVVPEAFGEPTGDGAAASIAEGWKQASDLGLRIYNEAGGDMGKIDRFGVPMHHDGDALVRLSVEKGHDAAVAEWMDFTRPLLDLDTMKRRWREGVFERKPQSQGEIANQALRARSRNREPNLLADVELDAALERTFDTIATRGFSKVDDETGQAGQNAFRRMEAHRFLIFKDADSWMKYRERFGKGDAYSAMTAYLDRIARETALMQVLGPRPETTFAAMRNLVEKAARERDLAEQRGGVAGAIGRDYADRAHVQIRTARDMYEMLAGSESATVDGHAAGIIAGVRNINTAALLGSATITAVPGDLSTQIVTRAINGLRVRTVLGDYLRQLNPLSAEDRKLAVRSWAVSEDYIHSAAAQARFIGDALGPNWTVQVSDTTLRLSGLSPWTSAGQRAFLMEFMGAIAEHKHLAFDALPGQLQKTLSHYGFAGKDWDTLRATPVLIEHRGAAFLRPNEILARTDLPPREARQLAYRYSDMMRDQQGYAVPSTTVRGRAGIMGRATPGSPAHFILSSTLMFKSFAMTVLHTWLKRIWTQPTWGQKLGWGAAFVGATTIAGGLSQQLYEIANGRDPLKMTSPRFWANALLRGGGLSIFGDLFYAATARGENRLPDLLAGPNVGLVGDVVNLASLGAAATQLGGQDVNPGRALVNLLRRHMPGGNLWYLRLAVARGIYDNLQRWLDPKASAAFRRDIQRRRKDFDQKYFFRPGRTAPDRAPDPSAAFQGAGT
jgi:hypothetical protein